MTENNTRQVNGIIAKSLTFASVSLVAILLLKVFGILDFSRNIIMTILWVGIPATLLPYFFIKLNLNDIFLKYYMMTMLSLLIGLLGMDNSIGIYITYIFVPLISCLYFEKKFTLHIILISYITMTIGVYFNSAGKLEVRFLDWTHMLTFRNYMIGFTIEYSVIAAFLLIMVNRAQKFFKLQQENLKRQQIENEKQKEISKFYKDSMPSHRTTVFDSVLGKQDSFSSEDFMKMTAGHRFEASIQELFKTSDNDVTAMNKALQSIGEYFELERIIYIEPEPGNNTRNQLSYSWAKREKYRLNNFYEGFCIEDYIKISAEYDKNGYIYINPINREDSLRTAGDIECGLTKYILSVAIGPQVWIPTLASNEYNGAVCFERLGDKPFSATDILVLSDLVATLSLNVMSRNADRANQAKSLFLSSMSHEIRTPMNAILGMTTVALREDMNDTVKKSLNIIKSSAEGLLAIINDILDFSKIESGKVEIINEDYQTLALMNDVKTIAEARNVEKHLELQFHIPEEIPPVLHGDMVRIKQVMVNLVNNAIKYTEKGSVNVYLNYDKKSDSLLNLDFRVVDTGQGIKEEDKNKLFNSFSQVNQEENHHKEGTGLGLAISKQLIELMGGTIGLESKYGEGTEFFFSVPQTIVNSAPAGNPDDFEYDSPGDDNEFVSFPGTKILIVDDNEVNRMVAEALFSIFEMDITMADGGVRAVELSKENKYDIIFMDHLMPDLDGLQATRMIREDTANPNVKTCIVALTADAVAGVKEKMLEAGMDDFLSKPINMKLATSVLNKHLNH